MTSVRKASAENASSPWRSPRRVPRMGELLPYVDLSRGGGRIERRLSACADIADLRLAARKHVPRMVFDFVDGAAGTESSLARCRDAFRRVEFEPRVLQDVSAVDLSVDILGQRSALPVIFAPTGGTRLVHHHGETAVAQAAASADIPYALSTLGNTSIEDLAARAPDARRWFQLYLMPDRSLSLDMVERAERAGFDTLVVAVDAAVPGRRNRDVRNGLAIPPKLTWRTMRNVARHPRWCWNLLTSEPIELAMVDAMAEAPQQRMARIFDASVTIGDLEWLRGVWQGKLVVKGVQSVVDAQMVASMGADAVHLSTHGGRQLDRAPVPFELLPEVRSALDDSVQLFVDGGVMSGADVVACLAQGATAVAVGRAYLYGLMAGGRVGVDRAVEILRGEIQTTLQLVGCPSAGRASDINVRTRTSTPHLMDG